MRAAQRRARSSGLRMHYRCLPSNGRTYWEITVDGSGQIIAAWSQQLRRELPIVAEGFVGNGMGRQARNLANSLVARWTDLCVGQSENARVTSSGSDTGHYFWPVMDVPLPPHPLEPRLSITDDLIGRWIVGDLPSEAAIEELHTSMEGLLRKLPRVPRRATWPAMLKIALDAGFITSKDKTALMSFNTQFRNRLKHRTLALRESHRVAVAERMSEVLDIHENLLGRIT